MARNKAAKIKPRKPSPAELANDPSLAYCGYRRWELLHSDRHQTYVRFVYYVGDHVRVADYESCGDLPGLVPVLQVRRPSAVPETV